jgi:tetratricopeptide (TPR) repeat protein
MIVSGEPGIGKSVLVAEAVARAKSSGFAVASGAASKESMQPFLVFSGALASLIGDKIFDRDERATFTTVLALDAATSGVVAQVRRDGGASSADAFAAMLSAVQSFIGDSFKEGGGSLGRLEHGDSKILIERAGGLSIVAALEGSESPEMRAALRKTAETVANERAMLLPALEGLAHRSFAVKRELEGMKLESERIRIANDVLDIFNASAADRPLLVVLEDIHWADESSLFALRYVARNLGGSNVLILATARPSEGEACQKTVASMKAEGAVSEISLTGLDLAGVGDLMRASMHPNDFPGDFAIRLHDDCGGNPFFISELLRQMVADGAIALMDGKYSLAKEDYAMPKSVSDIVARRLESLEEDAMAMAEYASCAGRAFPTSVALSAPSLEDPGESLRKLATAGIVTVEGEAGEFSHALFQAAVYDSLAQRWRAAHHRSIGEHYEGAYAGRLDDAAYELARHFSLSTEHAKAIDYGTMAGARAEGSFAMEQAVGFYESAVGALGRLGISGEREQGLRMKIGDLQGLLGRYPAAAASFGRAAALSAAQVRVWAVAKRKLAEILEYQGKWDEALAEIAGVESVLSNSHPLEMAGALVVKSFVLMRKGDFAGSQSAAEFAMGMLEGLDGLDARRESVNALTNISKAHLARGDYAESKRVSEQVLKKREELGDELGVAGALNNLANACTCMSERDEALGHLERALAILENRGDVRTVGIVTMNIGNLHAERGDYDVAMTFYDKAIERRRRIGDVRGVAVALNNVGVVQMERGDLKGALASYTEAHEVRAGLGDKAGAALTLRNIGCVRLDMGEAALAQEILMKAAAESDAIGDTKHTAFTLCWLAEAQLELGLLGEADGNCARAEELCKGAEVRDTLETARMVRGRIFAARKDYERAVKELTAAISSFEELGMPAETSKTRYHLAGVLSATGDILGARAELDKAVVAFKKLGSELWLKRCADALAKLDG